MRVGEHDFSEHTQVVICAGVEKGRPVGIYQHAPDGLSMVCGSEHGAEDLKNMYLHHLSERFELADLPKVDRGYGAFRDEAGNWNIFEDNDDA